MKKFLKKILGPFLTRLASNASAPDKKDVFKSLSKLLGDLNKKKNNRGLILNVDFAKDKFIIFSDHHKGNKDEGDDFASNEKNYLAALDYYFSNKFNYINLGDSEDYGSINRQKLFQKICRHYSLKQGFIRKQNILKPLVITTSPGKIN